MKTQAQEILAKIDHVINKMQISGEFWATIQCYKSKISTLTDAYIAGYTDAAQAVKEYILLHQLDKPSTRCYTPRKARKAHKK